MNTVSVVFCLQGQGNTDHPVMPRARLMVESIRKHMPNAKIIQLSNLDFAEVDGIDGIVRVRNDGDFARWSMKALRACASCYEQMLLIGTDMVIMEDVSSVFDDDFDIAASPYPLRTRTDGTYCGDGVFIKGYEVVDDMLAQYDADQSIQDGWDGQQIALMRTIKSGKFKVKQLEFDVYNRTPDTPKTDLTGAAIVHYRGNRKSFMLSDHGQKDMAVISSFESGLNTTTDTMIEQAEINLKRDLPLFVEVEKHDGEALIVGGGPSLHDVLPEFRLHRNRGGIIFALNGTHDWLIDRGIIPDFHVLLDAREENAAFVKTPHKDVTYLIAAQCHPAVFEALKGYNVIVWVSCLETSEKEHELAAKFAGKPLMMIGGGATVGLKAMNLAYLWGFRKFGMYGMDSSYQGEENHAYRQALNDKESRITIHAAGKDFICAPWMAKQATEFQRQYRQLKQLGCRIKVYGDGLIPHIYKQLEA